jgi:multidrug efflux system outer membrane protein
MSRTLKNASAVLLAMSLECGSLPARAKDGKKSIPDSVQTPARYAEVPAQGAAADMSSLAEWWQNFQDPELQSLIQRAINSNLDVRVARAKLRESRATFHNTRWSEQLPTVNTDGSYTRSKISSDNPQIPKLDGGGSPTTLIPTTYGVFQSYFDASYELDIFGGVRNQVRAARADAAASGEDLRNTLISTLAEVARDYLQLRQYQEQLRVAEQNEASQQDTLNITQVRRKAGLVSDLDVANAAASLASTRSSIPTLQAEIGQSVHAISVLLAQNPGDLNTELSRNTGIPAGPSEIPVGLPSELLRRRPDIRETERNIEAALARVKVQTAKFFPSISLTAQYGGQSGNAGHLVNAAARFYTMGPSLDWGLLNYPALKSNIRIYQAKRDEQILSYQKAVLTAFQNVEDALIAYQTEQTREKILENEVEQYRNASSLALTKYTRGLSNFLDVLEAQRSLYSAEGALVQSRATVQTNLISLYKALGGGWEKNDPVAAPEAKVTLGGKSGS